jgi:hypothetical protein
MLLPDALGLGDAGHIDQGLCLMTFAVSHAQIFVIVFAAYSDRDDMLQIPPLACMDLSAA